MEKQSIVGTVHLQVNAERRAKAVKNDRRVVTKSFHLLLEQGPDDDNASFLRGLRKALRTRPRNRLREVEEFHVVRFAEIRCEKEFRQTDNLSSELGGFTDSGNRGFQISEAIGPAAHLHQAERERVRHLSSH